MFRFVAADLIHPPLFYALLKIWIAIGGESLLWLRLLPALLSVAAIVPIVLLCRALKLDWWQTNVALGLLAVNGFLIKYAQEIRMYSLLFLLTCMSLWLFVRFTDQASRVRRLLPALLLVNLLLVYSHYSGWVVVFVELFVMVVWRRERLVKFLLTILALVLSYLPWLYLITISKEPGRGLAQNIGWVTRPGLSDVIQFFSMLNTPFFFRQSSANPFTDIWGIVLSVIVFGVPLAILIWRAIKDQGIAARNLDPLGIRDSANSAWFCFELGSPTFGLGHASLNCDRSSLRNPCGPRAYEITVCMAKNYVSCVVWLLDCAKRLGLF